MSPVVRRARVRPWAPPSISRRLLRFAWRCVRAFLVVLGAAIGPGMPPPPPPPPPPTEQIDEGGQVLDER